MSNPACANRAGRVDDERIEIAAGFNGGCNGSDPGAEVPVRQFRDADGDLGQALPGVRPAVANRDADESTEFARADVQHGVGRVRAAANPVPATVPLQGDGPRP